jgi:hypothetical protein
MPQNTHGFTNNDSHDFTHGCTYNYSHDFAQHISDKVCVAHNNPHSVTEHITHWNLQP